MTNGDGPVIGVAALGQRLRDLLGMLYPLHCLACGCQVLTGEALCPSCRKTLSRGPARCPRCAGPAGEDGGRCQACRNRPPPMGATLAPLAYREPVADWLRACKYRNQPGLAGPLATLVTAEASRWLGDSFLRQPVLIPVPLHRRRLARRGYNQAGLLARQWGRQLGLPVRHGALRRVRPTAAQAELGGRERRRGGLFGGDRRTGFGIAG